MLKTVKVKKNLRLDELIKHVWDNQLYPESFKSNFNDFAHFDKTGKYKLIDQRGINQATKFTVEVEEEITKNTIFDWIVGVNKSGFYEEEVSTISSIEDEDPIRIYALLDEKLQLIWEAESDVK